MTYITPRIIVCNIEKIYGLSPHKLNIHKGDNMATKSFFKTIDIKDQTSGTKLAEALEKSNYMKDKEVQLQSQSKELKGYSVKIFFDGYNK